MKTPSSRDFVKWFLSRHELLTRWPCPTCGRTGPNEPLRTVGIAQTASLTAAPRAVTCWSGCHYCKLQCMEAIGNNEVVTSRRPRCSPEVQPHSRNHSRSELVMGMRQKRCPACGKRRPFDSDHKVKQGWRKILTWFDSAWVCKWCVTQKEKEG